MIRVMNQVSTRPQHLFIVRVWYEPTAQGLSPWRGSVEHIPSGHKLYFTSLGDLNDFIAFKAAMYPLPGSQNTETS